MGTDSKLFNRQTGQTVTMTKRFNEEEFLTLMPH